MHACSCTIIDMSAISYQNAEHVVTLTIRCSLLNLCFGETSFLLFVMPKVTDLWVCSVSLPWCSAHYRMPYQTELVLDMIEHSSIFHGMLENLLAPDTCKLDIVTRGNSVLQFP